MIFPPLPGFPLALRLRGIGVDHHQEPIRRPHGYPQFQWIQVRSGRLRLVCAGTEAVARVGDGLFLRPDEPHDYRAEGDPAVVDWVGFDGPGVETALGRGPLVQSGVYRLVDTAGVDRVVEGLWRVAQEQGPATRLSAGVYDLVMVLTEDASVGRPPVRGRLETLVAALAHRPAHPWDAASLAALAGVSPQHLGRLFRRTLGQSPLEYLARLRVNRALQLLVERPELRVHEVGEAVGYPDANYFIRVFRRLEGVSPGEFRRLHGLW